MLSRIAQGHKEPHVTSVPEAVSALDETLKRILDHAKSSGMVDHLCLCLANSGSSLISGSSSMLRAACEACRAIWSLIDALEMLSIKESSLLFPLNALRSHSLVRLGKREHEGGSLVGAESAKVVDVVTRAFVTSKAIQVAIYYCLHQRFEAAMSAGIQVFVSHLKYLRFLCTRNIPNKAASYMAFNHFKEPKAAVFSFLLPVPKYFCLHHVS